MERIVFVQVSQGVFLVEEYWYRCSHRCDCCPAQLAFYRRLDLPDMSCISNR